MIEIGWLILVFAELSLLAVGGVVSTLPEMQRQVIQVHHWLSPTEFAALFALAQAAPGPNMLVSALIGRRVAGLAGALAATLAIIGPSSVLTWAVAGAWHRFRDRPWRKRVQAGLVPVTVGLVAAGAALLVQSTTQGPATAAICLAVAAAVLGTKLHPLWLLAGGAVLGMAGAG